MPINKEDLLKFTPEQRIKKLKELEEERKKEIVEAEDLIKRTEAEIEREKNVPNVEVPEIRQVDIARLFEATEGLEAQLVTKPKEEDQGPPIKYVAVALEENPGIMYVEHPEAERPQKKTEELVKYESAFDQVDEATASRSALKNIKKYTMG